jgi:hypothetical protein
MDKKGHNYASHGHNVNIPDMRVKLTHIRSASVSPAKLWEPKPRPFFIYAGETPNAACFCGNIYREAVASQSPGLAAYFAANPG